MADRPDWSGTLHISKSQLTTYLICPRKFWFQYVRGHPWEFVPASLAFGRAVHETAAEFYRFFAEHFRKPEFDWLLDRFRRFWLKELDGDDVRFFGRESLERLTERGEAMLDVFYTETRPRRVRAVETPFTVPLTDDPEGASVKLVGILDLLEEDDEGDVIVSELKTSSKRYSDLQGEHQLDGLVYSYAVNQLGLASSTNGELLVRYDVLVKTKKPAFQQVYVTKNSNDFTRFTRWVSEILHAIDSGVFYPNYGWQCQQCPFQKACRNS